MHILNSRQIKIVITFEVPHAIRQSTILYQIVEQMLNFKAIELIA